MVVPSEVPTDTPHKWTKTHDGEVAKVWRNGEGDMIALTQSFNAVTDYWEVTDTTGEVVEGRACGPFETYLDALEYVNKLKPRFGREELPDEVASTPDDEIVEVASIPSGATDRECNGCGKCVFTSFRIEYGDGSHEWNCIKCAKDRFNWSLDDDSTVGFNVNGSGAEGRDAHQAAETLISAYADALLGAEIIDVNGLASVMQTLGRYKYDGQRENPDEPSPAYGFKRDVHNLIIEYRDEHPDIKWNEIRDALNELRQYAHEYAREELGESKGRRELLEEIKQSDMTPNEWFEQNIERDSGDA